MIAFAMLTQMPVDADLIRATRSALTTEHYFDRKLRPHRRLSEDEANEVLGKATRQTNAYFPRLGKSIYKRALIADSPDLKAMLASSSYQEVWAAIGESAWRGDTSQIAGLASLAKSGWTPAAFALSDIPGDDKPTAVALIKSKYPGVRLWASFTLAKLGDRRGTKGIWDYLATTPRMSYDLGGPVRTDYALALLPFCTQDSVSLVKIVSLSGSQRLSQFLAPIKTVAARKALAILANDSYHGKREWALTVLALRPDGKPVIEKAARESKYPDTVRFAKKTLAHLASGDELTINMNGYRWKPRSY